MGGTLLFIVLMLLILVPGVILTVHRFRLYLQQEKERESKWDAMVTGDQLAAVLKKAKKVGAEEGENGTDG
jgi:Tfp pilus assembly protein PilX